MPFISLLTDPDHRRRDGELRDAGRRRSWPSPAPSSASPGPRVIAETIRQPLPEGFQRSEFLLQHGQLDLVVERRELRETLRRILALLRRAAPLAPRP